MSAPSGSQTTTPATAASTEVLPGVTTLVHAARLAIKEDKPVLFDYFMDTYNGKAFMGEDTDTKEKMLVKSSDEFTSLIQKVYKVQEDFIVMTENSIYLVSGKIQKRRIQAAQMRSANNPEYETLS
jgi:hypothetical protein